MSSTDRGLVLQQLDRLFRDGTLAGLGDGQLLERYRNRRDEAAFEALVELHGPMVLGLCRRFLRDPRDIEDAFQATFLVLVRKAPLIRDGGLLANWLYGVALRVATRSRANLLRRRTREQAIGEAEFAALPDVNDVLGMGPVLDQELSRLPAKYRAPLVSVLLARADSRPGRARAALPRRDRSKPDGPRARFAQATADAPGICPDRRTFRPGAEPAGTSPHRDRASPSGCRHGRSGLRNRLVTQHSGRRGRRVCRCIDPRSSHVDETRTTEMDRRGPRRHRNLGRRGDRNRRSSSAGPGSNRRARSLVRWDRGPAGGRNDGN